LKNIIYRKCIVTNEVCDRKQLLRLVLVGDYLQIDNSYSLPGRGYYIKNQFDVLKKVIDTKIIFNKLHKKLSSKTIDELTQIINRQMKGSKYETQ